MNNNHVYDMLVVGGGPGGYTAALYAARAGLDTIVLEKLSAGGQMALTEQIDNYPGFEDGIDGFSLAEKMQKQAERFGVRSEYAEVLRMDLTAIPKLLETSEGIFRGKTVVLATRMTMDEMRPILPEMDKIPYFSVHRRRFPGGRSGCIESKICRKQC